LASSCWVSCLRWRSFFRLVSLRTLQILTKLVHAAQFTKLPATPLPLFTKLPTETVRKGVRATLLPWIWEAYGGQNGAKSFSLAAHRAMLKVRPRLFGQFHKECSRKPQFHRLGCLCVRTGAKVGGESYRSPKSPANLRNQISYVTVVLPMRSGRRRPAISRQSRRERGQARSLQGLD
jgi:hypothetical protein